MIRVVAVGLTAVAVLAACDSGVSSGPPVVDTPLIGEAPKGADAALYFDITTSGDDELVGVEVDIAERTALHELRAVEGGAIMWPVERIELPAGDTVELRPFGSHVMLEELRDDLAAGDVVTVSLSFSDHEPVVAEAVVVPLLELAERYPEGER